MPRRWLPIFALIALGAAACRPRSGTDVGNGATASFDLGAYHPRSMPRSHVDHGAKIETFLLAAGDFRMRRGTECTGAEATNLVLEGPLVADLVREDAGEERDTIELAPGAHCFLRASTLPLPEGSLPADVVADGPVTVFVSGVRADGVRFSVLLDRELKLDLLSPSDKRIDVRDEAAFVMAFDVDAAIVALELEGIEEDPIRIDTNSNPSSLNAFAKSLRKSASLFADEDGDGILSDAESTEDKSVARGTD